MSKRLIIIMALALVVGIAAAAYAEVQNVKVSGDLTTLGVDRNRLSLRNNAGLYQGTATAAITRLKVDANLTENVDACVRVINDRVWGVTDVTAASTDIDLDLAYVSLKDFFVDVISVPLTVVLGRQEIKIGNGTLIGAPGTNQGASVDSGFYQTPMADLSTRSGFDAVVGVWNWTDQLTAITGVVKATEANVYENTVDGESNVWVADVVYDFGEDAMSTKAGMTLAYGDGKDNQVTFVGGRVALSPMENLGVNAEYIYQASKAIARDAGKTSHASDGAFLMGASLGMPDVVWMPTFGVDYARFSGNWNAFHESLSPAALMNTIFPQTNAQVIGATVSAKPMDDLMMKFRFANARVVDKYSNGFTWQNASWNATPVTYTMTSKSDLGSEYDLCFAYDYTADVKLGLDLGYFRPGKAFDKDANRKSASQAIASMKVTF